MSKKLIAGAGIVAALGVIALPLGAFAASSTTWTEVATVSVKSACAVNGSSSSPSGEINISGLGEIANGNAADSTATSYKVVCNNATGWELKAVGASDTTNVNKMIGTTGTNIDTADGSVTSGQTAGSWSFKVTGATGLTGSYGSTFKAIPATEQTVLSSDGATDATSGTFSTQYHVYVGTETPAGTYVGKVKYTLYTK